MDTLRGPFNEDPDADEDEVAVDVLPVALGRDERRMQVHAYNHWSSLLGAGDFPAIDQLDLAALSDFAPCAVLMDFTGSDEAPYLAHIGERLAEQAGIDTAPRPLADVPPATLLSRFTDHYVEIFANRAPIGFEADFQTPAGTTMLYRGILLPFSRDGAAISHILGVINWKEQLGAAASETLLREMRGVMGQPFELPGGDLGSLSRPATPPGARPRRWDWAGEGWSDKRPTVWPLGEEAIEEAGEGVELWPATPTPASAPASAPPHPSHSLTERLNTARALAQEARKAPPRDHGALYAAIGAAHDLSLAADEAPQEAAALLAAHHLAPKPHTPWLPFVKLVFGAGHDKTRLTEYATALAHARQAGLGMGSLPAHLMTTPGGLKGIVAAQRRQKRAQWPAGRRHGLPVVLAQALASLPACAWGDVADDGAITLAVVRNRGGQIEPLGPLGLPHSATERLLRQFLGQQGQAGGGE